MLSHGSGETPPCRSVIKVRTFGGAGQSARNHESAKVVIHQTLLEGLNWGH